VRPVIVVDTTSDGEESGHAPHASQGESAHGAELVGYSNIHELVVDLIVHEGKGTVTAFPDISTCSREQFGPSNLATELGAETAMQRYVNKSIAVYLLFENTTGSSPVMSTNRSFQSSSHVLAYPSLNRTSRFCRMLTVAIRSSKTESSQYNLSVIVEWVVPRIANGFPTQLVGPTRKGRIEKPSFNPQLRTKRLTVGEWDKRSSVVCEFSFCYGTRELH